MTAPQSSFGRAACATLRREWLSHRINRFLYWHLGLLTATGVLALLIAPANAERGVTWFILNAVLYVISLSSALLGLSSAQAEADELPFLATQPMGFGPWVAGKAAGLITIVLPSPLLLIVPWLLAQGWSPVLGGFAAATAGVCMVLAMLGLAVGLWIREPVRALITAVALWLILLFATDLLLLLAAGTPWIREHPAFWALPLMLNPLDTLRVTTMLAIEGAAINTIGSSALVRWWAAHSAAWLTACVLLWTAVLHALALAAANRVRRG